MIRLYVLLLDIILVRSATILIIQMQANTLVTITDQLREHFARAQRVLALTGAGVSAESGVLTFRGGSVHG